MSKDKIIFPLDVSSESEARELIAELSDEVGAFKIGLQLFSALGPGFVRELTESGIKLFLDVKFHDIPNTVASAAVEVTRLGVWMFNIHTFGGLEMMMETRKRVDEFVAENDLPKPLIIGVTVLTSMGDDQLAELDVSKSADDMVVKLAVDAFRAGLDGVVASGLEVKRIKEATSDDFVVVTPGIRPAFATLDDQKRVVTPETAIENGADFLVVGRPIRTAENRVEAARAVAGEINSI